MRAYRTVISSKGQVVIPAELRERLGLKQKHSLGYADAFAAELAIERGAWLVTADPEFSKVGKALSIYRFHDMRNRCTD